MKILLVGNYRPDRQESMQRFAELLQRELVARGHQARLVRPQSIFNRSNSPAQGKAKWFGYLDKFIVFPWVLKRAARRADLVHIVDHSNAPYIRAIGRQAHLITCNDVLAIRSALGHFPYNPVGWSGKLLQKLILSGLNRARQVACISENTRTELLQVSSLASRRVTTIYMGQNYAYSPLAPHEIPARLAPLLKRTRQQETSVPSRYILHVGANHWYKNRIGTLHIYSHLCQQQGVENTPLLVMVGEPISAEMQTYITESGLQDKVVSLTNTDNEALRALYCGAELLLFPSLAEGFGWPIAEAQACGCRVVTTNRAPMTEVGGDAAVYLVPENEPEAARVVAQVLAESETAKDARIKAGLRQAAQFSTTRMIEAYLQLYEQLTRRKPARTMASSTTASNTDTYSGESEHCSA